MSKRKLCVIDDVGNLGWQSISRVGMRGITFKREISFGLNVSFGDDLTAATLSLHFVDADNKTLLDLEFDDCLRAEALQDGAVTLLALYHEGESLNEALQTAFAKFLVRRCRLEIDVSEDEEGLIDPVATFTLSIRSHGRERFATQFDIPLHQLDQFIVPKRATASA